MAKMNSILNRCQTRSTFREHRVTESVSRKLNKVSFLYMVFNLDVNLIQYNRGFDACLRVSCGWVHTSGQCAPLPIH